QLEKILRDGVARENYDLVYVYYLRSAETALRALAPAGSHQPQVLYLALQLSQTLNIRRIRGLKLSALERLIYAIESGRVALYEATIWRNFTRTVLIGP